MRSVAAGLGVTPMAVYYYVADKEDLLRLVVERISESYGMLETVPGADWQDTLRNYLVAIWENTRRYPGLGAQMINQPGLGVTPERLKAGIGFFEDAGFPPPHARLAWSFATTYIHGRLSVDAHLGHKPDAPHLDGLKARDYVEFGVETVIAGLEAILDRERLARVGAGSSAATRTAPKNRKRRDG
jgi:AcrR family transcriptional regulator